ncbi:ABC transporter ATP-binding protein [Neotamlana sedimentorum]|uniref:ABC transporter ATP-binding protein n=1 Tax=Neotamlana sedimentorum TaxID=1435349 RepID=UPI0009E39781|nr:ABC transporter ATP-binding protein [Tamlana sedimentorum]
MENDEVLVKVEGLSKKFCKDLKTSLWYGVKDLISGVKGNKNERTLRPKEFWAVKDVNFELRRGECLGLIGHNGAGKSTLLKILNGLINPDAGQVTIRGRVGALIELGAGFNPILSGRENIYNNGAVLGFTRNEIDNKLEDIIDFAEIREFIDMPVQNYSSGMKVRLGFAIAAQMEPDVLIIDEVLAVGDLAFRMKCYNHLMNVISKNVAIILVSHSVVDIMRLCNSVMVMESGKPIYLGSNEKGVSLYNNLAKKENLYNPNFNVFIRENEIENDFNTEDDITFDIKIFSNFKIESAKLIFHLEFSSIRLASISSNYNQFELNLEQGENNFEFTLEKTPLLVGGYMGKFDLYGKTLKDYYGTSNTTTFNIIGPKVNYEGLGRSQIIALNHNWKKKN